MNLPPKNPSYSMSDFIDDITFFLSSLFHSIAVTVSITIAVKWHVLLAPFHSCTGLYRKSSQKGCCIHPLFAFQLKLLNFQNPISGLYCQSAAGSLKNLSRNCPFLAALKHLSLPDLQHPAV